MHPIPTFSYTLFVSFFILCVGSAQANEAPAYSSAFLTSTGSAAGIGFSGNASGGVADPDGDPLTYSIAGPAWFTVDPDGSFSGTAPASAVGTNTFTITATDPSGASDSVPFYVIIPVNLPPSWAPAPRILPSAPENTFYTSGLGPFVSDPELRNMTYTLISGPDWLSVNSGGIVFGTPRNQHVGDNTAVVEMRDEVNPPQQATVTIPVLEVNDPPRVTADPFTVRGLRANIPFNRSIAEYSVDEEGDPFEFSLLSGPSWLSLTTAGVASGTPLSANVGTNDFIYQVADFTGGSDTGTLRLVVAPSLNSPPVFSSIAPVTVEEGTLVSGTLMDAASDVDGNSLNFQKVSGPSWLTVNINGQYQGTPSMNDLGQNTFVFRVEDPSKAGDETTFLVEVVPSCTNEQVLASMQPMIDKRSLMNGNLKLNVSSVEPGLSYHVEITSDLQTGAWSTAAMVNFEHPITGSFTNTDGQMSQYEVTSPTMDGKAELAIDLPGISTDEYLFFRLRLLSLCP